MAIAYLFENQLVEAEDILTKAIVECKKLKNAEYVDAEEMIIQALEKFIFFYTDKDLIKVMYFVTLSREHLNVTKTAFGDKLNTIERLILAKVAAFFSERAIASAELLDVSELRGIDGDSGELLIKFNSQKLFTLVCDQVKSSNHPVRLNILTNDRGVQFDLAVTIVGSNHLESFMSCCRIALEKLHQLEAKMTKPQPRPQQTVPSALTVENLDDSSFDPYSYGDNSSDDLYPRSGKNCNGRATLKKSLELWQKELKARREGEFKSPQLLPVNFETTGCVYDKSVPCSVVAIEFMGTNDVWYGVLNPDIAKLIPVSVRQQIIDKFKTGIWPQAAYEDCRQEMKAKSKQTGNKDLKKYILKIRILGHEFGDIRIYGIVIETVENPNCKGHFCNLLAFTGFALNGHKDLPVCYVIPKLTKDGSSSENDDTGSSPEDSSDSISRSSLDM